MKQQCLRDECTNRFHWCPSCGWNSELHAMSEGYCSDECLVACGGTTYDEMVDAEEEANS